LLTRIVSPPEAVNKQKLALSWHPTPRKQGKKPFGEANPHLSLTLTAASTAKT
jgi:hypothetical protein